MPNCYTGTNNYEAYKAGRGGIDNCKIFFIVPKDYTNAWRNQNEWYQESYSNSRFFGTKAECERNLINYPDHKII